MKSNNNNHEKKLHNKTGKIAPGRKSTFTKGTAFLLFILSAVFFALIYFGKQYGNDVRAQVACTSIDGGHNCEISLLAGSAPEISVCWDLNNVCANGIRIFNRRCFSGHLDKESSAHVLIANSDFENYAKCNRVSSTVIENVRIGVSNGIIKNGTFE